MAFALQAETAPIQFDEHGIARIAHTRVTLESVLWTYLQGASPEEIAPRFPSLELADIYAVISYYLRHRDDVEQYLREAEANENRVRDEYEAIFPQNGLREKLLARRKALHGE